MKKYPHNACLDTPLSTPVRRWIVVDDPGLQKTKSLDFSRLFAAVGDFDGPVWTGPWRSRWDSNPRYGITVHRISSPAHSTTLPPLLIRFAWCEGRYCSRGSLALPCRSPKAAIFHAGRDYYGHP